MNPRRWLRGAAAVALTVAVLGAIGLMLRPAQARSSGVFDWPGAFPCDTSLQACVNSLQSGDVIHLLPGTYTQSVTLIKPVSLIGDGPGWVQLSAPPGQRVLSIGGPIGAGTVISGFSIQNGDLPGSLCPAACGGGMLITGTARPTLQNLEFFNNVAGYQGGGLWVAAGPEIGLSNVTFYSNSSAYAGGGLYSEAPLALANSYFDLNRSILDNGGGAYVTGLVPNLKAANTLFNNNHASFGGGALVNGTVVLTGSSFSYNDGVLGGGLYAGALVMTNTSFYWNSAFSSSGGGAYVNGDVQFADVIFASNSAYSSGGGVYAARLNGRGAEFFNNTVSGFGDGGGAYFYTGTNALEDALFQGNSASYGGGGLYAGGQTTLRNVTMLNNIAQSGYGGAVYLFGKLDVNGGKYQGNSAVLDGGGLHVQGPLQLSGARFEGNSSLNSGGALYVDGNLSVTNTRFISNTATDGSAVWFVGSDGRVVNSLFARNHDTGSVVAELSINSPAQFTVLHSTFADPKPSTSAAIGVGSATVNVTDTIITKYAYGIAVGNGAVSEDYNLYFSNSNNWTGQVITGIHSFEADPLFVDPGVDDYHVQPGSPAVNAGVNVGVNFDIDGQPRPLFNGFDIGFDEMGSQIQQWIDDAPRNGTVTVPPGVYTESLRLWKPVNLIGTDAKTTIVNALPGQRVMNILDQSITTTTVISGLTFRHGVLLDDVACPQDCGGGIFIGAARPRLQNIVLLENHAYQGGGLWVDSGSELLLDNVLVSNNSSSSHGGGLYANSAFRAINSRFERNFSNQAGGGAYTFDVATLESSVFANNRAQWQGGGLRAGELTMIDGEFLNNSGLDGGGAYLFSVNSPTQRAEGTAAAPDQTDRVNAGSALITGGKFTGNLSDGGDGGGLYAYGNAQISGTLFANNTSSCFGDCTAYGGGAYVGGSAMVDNASFLNNTALNGGGLFAGILANLRSVALVGNQAEAGGGLFLMGDYDINASRFVNNRAQNRGGGLFAYAAGSGRVVNSLFTRNQGDASALEFFFSGPADVIYTTIADTPRVTGTAIRVENTDLNLLNSIIVGQQLGLESFGVVTQSHNLYFNNQLDVTGTVTAAGLIITGVDPRFANPLIDDYHLTFGSPAINQGADAGITDDVDGQTRPIGAGFEIGFDETFTTIQEAIDLTPPGGTVNIPAGVYTESLTLYKPVSLIGAGRGNTIVNAVTGERVLTVTGSTITPSTVIANFTLRGGDVRGRAGQGFGGGVLIATGARPTFANVAVSDNQADLGGGVFVDSGAVDLVDSEIANNTAAEGAGVYVRPQAGPTILVSALRGGLVLNNRATGSGGGAYLASQFNITGTRFFLNSAYDGSAVEITGTADARLVNAFIGENVAHGPFPGTNASVRFDSTGSLRVLHTTFGNNTVPLTRALAVNSGVVTVANTIVASYTNGLSQFGGRLSEDYNLFFQTPVTFTGSISQGGNSLHGLDPLFKNPVVGDYHVKGFSPVVDQGINVGVRRDIDQDARPLADRFDIGADEAAVASTNAHPLLGGSFTYTTPQSSTINLVVPPGAVTGTVPLYCTLVQSSTTPLPNRLNLAGFMFELNAQFDPLSDTVPGTINFNVPVTLTVTYTDQQLADAGITDESTLLLYRFESSVNEWKPIGYRLGETQTLDMANNVLSATLLGFSRFGQLGASGDYLVFLPLIMRSN
jgi:predicted outer membrane repeat protein